MSDRIIDVVRSLVVIFGLLTTMAYTTWFERRVISRMQVRIGPNRVGPNGLLQPLADAIKLFFKEDVRPAMADPFLYPLAPGISLLAALAAFVVIPVGPTINIGGKSIDLIIQKNLTLQLELQMNDGFGEWVIDASGFERNGSLLNMNTSRCWVKGVNGTGLDLDGIDDHLELQGDLSAYIENEITVSAWVNARTSTGAAQAVISEQAGITYSTA